MSPIVAIGERARVQGFALAGVTVVVAENADAVQTAWRGLGGEVELVILTRLARRALADEDHQRGRRPLAVVLPE